LALGGITLSEMRDQLLMLQWATLRGSQI
jgi:hypothetical protein